MSIRVAIVDDQTLVREGIRSLLALSEDVEVVGDAPDGDAALALLDEVAVDVLLLDLRMPRRDGISTLHALAERPDPPPVLVLTTFDDDELVRRIMDSFLEYRRLIADYMLYADNGIMNARALPYDFG